jgi:hypothetical protein
MGLAFPVRFCYGEQQEVVVKLKEILFVVKEIIGRLILLIQKEHIISALLLVSNA